MLSAAVLIFLGDGRLAVAEVTVFSAMTGAVGAGAGAAEGVALEAVREAVFATGGGADFAAADLRAGDAGASAVLDALAVGFVTGSSFPKCVIQGLWHKQQSGQPVTARALSHFETTSWRRKATAGKRADCSDGSWQFA
jgi:hypothetical protein